MYFNELTAMLSIAGYFEQNTTLPELDKATCQSQPRLLRYTYFHAGKNMIQIDGLKERPNLEINLDETAIEVESARKNSFNGYWFLARYSKHKTIAVAWTWRFIIEHRADLTSNHLSGIRNLELTSYGAWRSLSISPTMAASACHEEQACTYAKPKIVLHHVVDGVSGQDR